MYFILKNYLVVTENSASASTIFSFDKGNTTALKNFYIDPELGIVTHIHVLDTDIQPMVKGSYRCFCLEKGY